MLNHQESFDQGKIETVPLTDEKNKIIDDLREWIISHDDENCRVIITDPDFENDIF